MRDDASQRYVRLWILTQLTLLFMVKLLNPNGHNNKFPSNLFVPTDTDGRPASSTAKTRTGTGRRADSLAQRYVEAREDAMELKRNELAFSVYKRTWIFVLCRTYTTILLIHRHRHCCCCISSHHHHHHQEEDGQQHRLTTRYTQQCTLAITHYPGSVHLVVCPASHFHGLFHANLTFTGHHALGLAPHNRHNRVSMMIFQQQLLKLLGMRNWSVILNWKCSNRAF